ncbi:hypothetical protein VB712_19380 [Spirulina sp. CCNP1310]|uniref:hypothetical protein n=1 Tax=Spirulina sp. CCNP1310 TaxID=3110249 RepID=UPI002B1F01ED|nr:hypothetical protein [Spirulina sp. CCNP1310]MEA5421393.1 hypothetical protein [Spirulina sp. CCNP1310]
MPGSPQFSLEQTNEFARTLKKLVKSKAYDKNFNVIISEVIWGLLNNPYPSNSRDEPLPRGTRISKQWTFHKLTIKIGKGASGQVRLIYLVNEIDRIVKPLWIYNHEQFKKRPPDKELRKNIEDSFEE